MHIRSLDIVSTIVRLSAFMEILTLPGMGGQITGKYWSNCKIDEPSELSTDMDVAEQLVAKCQQLTKV